MSKRSSHGLLKRSSHGLLHRLWTKAVGTPNYVKEEWHELQRILTHLERRKAERRKEER